MAYVMNISNKEKKTWNFKTKKKRNMKKPQIKVLVDENNNNHKTSASILYELLAKEGKWPVYELLLEKPTTPWFIYRVSFANISLSGEFMI